MTYLYPVSLLLKFLCSEAQSPTFGLPVQETSECKENGESVPLGWIRFLKGGQDVQGLRDSSIARGIVSRIMMRVDP